MTGCGGSSRPCRGARAIKVAQASACEVLACAAETHRLKPVLLIPRAEFADRADYFLWGRFRLHRPACGRMCRNRCAGNNRLGRAPGIARAPEFRRPRPPPPRDWNHRRRPCPRSEPQIVSPAIFFTESSTNARFLPPMPSPVTGELTSPSAMTATDFPGFACLSAASCARRKSTAFSTGQLSVVLSQTVMNSMDSEARCAA